MLTPVGPDVDVCVCVCVCVCVGGDIYIFLSVTNTSNTAGFT